MKVKLLGIGSDCLSIHSEKENDFIGYIGRNMFYFDKHMLDVYDLFEGEIIDIVKPMIKEVMLNEIKLIEL